VDNGIKEGMEIMNIVDLQMQIKSNTLEHFYLFSGEESKVMDIYIQKIAQGLGVKPTSADTVAGIFNSLKSTNVLKTRKCYVIKEDASYFKEEKVWDSFINGIAQGEHTIILVFQKMDKRSKFYKRHIDHTTMFESLAPEVLAKYANKEIGLDLAYGYRLAEMCDCSYSRLLLECDKIYQLSKSDNSNIDAAFKKALKYKLIHMPPKDVVFDLIDAICRRNITDCFYLYEELKQVEPSPLGVISLLYSNVRAMLLVNSFRPGEHDLSNKTGLTGWQIKLAKEKGNHYSLKQLVSALKTINWTEQGIKTGKIESSMAMYYILCKIL
jgi:DNA polymerase III delta subunit